MLDKRKIKARLNEAAKAWKAAEVIPGNEAEVAKLKGEVCILAYELAEDTDLSQPEKLSIEKFSAEEEKRKEESRRKEGKKELDISTLPRVLEEAMDNYDATASTFSYYFEKLLEKRNIDIYRHNKIFNPAYESLDREISLPTGDTVTFGDTIPSDLDAEEDALVHIRLLSIIVEQTSLVLDFFQRHTGLAANETRYMWYKLFFTEDITNICKEAPSVIQHPRNVFSAMELAYLDYYMSKTCRTPLEIRRTSPKPYCDIVPDSDDCSTTWLDLDFPADVSLSYLLETTGNKPGRSARSNQLKFYREELKGCL